MITLFSLQHAAFTMVCAAVINIAASQHTVACLTLQNCPLALHTVQFKHTLYSVN